MFRTKLKSTICLLAFSACLILASGCTPKTNTTVKQVDEMLNLNAISGDSSAAENVYQLAEVTIGDISETDAAMGSITFPITHNLYHEYEHGTVIFKYFQSKSLGTLFVEEGEIIAVLELIIEPIAKEEARIKYEKALQTYENSLEKKLEDIEDLQEDITNETNIYKKQILELDYEVALEAYNEYTAEQTEYLEELKAVMELYSQDSSEIIITSPCTGLLATNTFSTGDVISPGESLGTVFSTEKAYVQIGSRSAANFRFGSNVEIMISSVTPAITLQGTVISAPNILYNVSSATAIVSITSAFPEMTSISNQARNRLSVVCHSTYVDNGVIIPANSLSNARGSTGVVYVLENGSIVKKNVKYGYRGSDYAWILEGLEPGQQVTTK